MMDVSKNPYQGKLENICNRINMKREFTGICCIAAEAVQQTLMFSNALQWRAPANLDNHQDLIKNKNNSFPPLRGSDSDDMKCGQRTL